MPARDPIPVGLLLLPEEALLAMARLSVDDAVRMVSAVWCDSCGRVTQNTVTGCRGSGQTLVLEGTCVRCGCARSRVVGLAGRNA
jgi:hypothetical protein